MSQADSDRPIVAPCIGSPAQAAGPSPAKAAGPSQAGAPAGPSPAEAGAAGPSPAKAGAAGPSPAKAEAKPGPAKADHVHDHHMHCVHSSKAIFVLMPI